MKFEDFWYVVAQSRELSANQVLSRTVLGEWLAVFRDEAGRPVALRDRCLHRNSRLSRGQVRQGQIHCPYHGWAYDGQGAVVAVPAEGETFRPAAARCARAYETCEQDGFVYVRLSRPEEAIAPFAMPHYGQPGWQTVRLVHRFANSVTNCAENFIDIPHTVSVHPGIFRSARQQQLTMTVKRSQGSVIATYHNETTNLGWYRRFLNPQGSEIDHTDAFHMPNVTSVEYRMGPRRHCFITSQSVPETETSTLVYTDVTFNYGLWSWLARPLVYWTARRIIAQDVEALALQQSVIEKYGTQFAHTPVDGIHCFVESIREAIAAGQDPRSLPDRTVEVTFWV